MRRCIYKLFNKKKMMDGEKKSDKEEVWVPDD